MLLPSIATSVRRVARGPPSAPPRSVPPLDFQRQIDGVTASGIEVENPESFRATFDESAIELWVDIRTNWPVRIAWGGTSKGNAVRAHAVIDRFQWNPSLSASDFAFEIPSDYTMIGRAGAVQRDEAGAIEGLREYARFTGGRYPSSLSYATALHEAEREIESARRSGRFTPQAFENLLKIQNTCAFRADLAQAAKDVAYYGDRVSTRDFDQVLLRWRLDEDSYRVIYGDLRAETVSAARLAEIESRR